MLQPGESPGAGNGVELIDEFFAMAREFGADGVISACEARILKNLGNYIKAQIQDSDGIPQSVKDRMCAMIDDQIDRADSEVPPGAGDGMCDSPCEQALDTWCELIEQGLELANEQGLCGDEALDFAFNYAREGMEQAFPDADAGDSGDAAEGSEPADGTPQSEGDGSVGSDYDSLYAEGMDIATSQGMSGAEAEAFAEEYATEQMNEGGSAGDSSGGAEESGSGTEGAGSGSSSGGAASTEDGYVAASNATAQQTSDEERSGGRRTGGSSGGIGKGNWLLALAGSMALMQEKFLKAAMDNMADMARLAEDVVVSGEDGTDEEKKAAEQNRREFLLAQSQYQANIQMFNMMANMTATSLKSIGEGLTAIARKQ